MICPRCNGAGRIRKRFLIVFKRWKRCPTCLGSGEYPPAVGDPRTLGGYRRRWRDDDDDRDTWVARGYGAGAVAARIDDARDQGTQARDDAFEVGSGGRSGGGGATASWGDASEDKAPVIVDPFAGESSTVGRAIVAEAADAIDSGSSGGESPADAGDSSVDSGTSY